jgi:hypothetical protein
MNYVLKDRHPAGSLETHVQGANRYLDLRSRDHVRFAL